jgi:hypothetical protein
VDPGGSWGRWSPRILYPYAIGGPALLSLGLILLAHVQARLGRSRRGRGGTWLHARLAFWRNEGLGLLWLVQLVPLAVLVVIWAPYRRLAYPFILLNLVLAVVTWQGLAQWLLAPRVPGRRAGEVVAGVILLASLPLCYQFVKSVYLLQRRGGFPYSEDGAAWREAGKWLRDHAAGSVTMTREPGILHFYSGEKAIQIPRAELDQIIEVMRFYRVTHLIPRLDLRPALQPLLTGGPEGLPMVHAGRLKIYEVPAALPDAAGRR